MEGDILSKCTTWKLQFCEIHIFASLFCGQVTIGTQISFSFTQTHMVTSDINTYYPFLGAQYAQGYRLLSFYRIPGQTRVTGFMNATVAVPFQVRNCSKFWFQLGTKLLIKSNDYLLSML